MNGKWKYSGSAAALLVLVLAGGLWLTGSDAAGVADANDAAQVARGEKIYTGKCAVCHGAGLEGEPNWRQKKPDGSFGAPPHDATGHTWHHADSHLFAYTKSGGKALAPPGFKSNMPGFGEDLADGYIWAVLAFIKSRWPARIQRRQAERNR